MTHKYLTLYTHFLRLGIFIAAFYAYVMVAPVLGLVIAATGIFSFLFRLRSFLLVPDKAETNYWELAMVGLIFVYALIFIGGLYEGESWVDIPMHLAGGLFAAWWAALMFTKEREGMSTLKQLLLIVAVAVLIGAAWECFEWTLDHTLVAWRHLPKMQPSNTDTIFDLINDCLGAVAIALLLIRKKGK